MMKKRTTKELLRETIKELMSERPLDAISVQEILTQSGISRTTFYKHFYDKQDLVEYTFKNELVETNFCDFSRSLEEREILCLNYLKENRYFYLNALKSSTDKSFYQMWIETAYETLLGYFQHILKGNDSLDEKLPFICRFTAYGWVNMNIDWLKEINGESVEEFSRKLNLMLYSGIGGFMQ